MDDANRLLFSLLRHQGDPGARLDAQLAVVPADREQVADARGRVWGYSIAADTLAGTSVLAAGFAAYFLISELTRAERARGQLPGGWESGLATSWMSKSS